MTRPATVDPMAAEHPSPTRLRAVRSVVLRWVVCVAAAAILGLPTAAAWAVTHTEVEDDIGTTPTTFTLSTRGQSEVRLGIAGTVYVPRAIGPHRGRRHHRRAG